MVDVPSGRDQSGPRAAREAIFEGYFRIFPWELLAPGGGIGADIGCGTGRWAMMVFPRAAHLHLIIDVSPETLAVARENLAGCRNVASTSRALPPSRCRTARWIFAFSLGLLHQVPDTQAAIDAIAGKLKRGAPFLIYLYYAFDNCPLWYRVVWQASNLERVIVSRFLHRLRTVVSETIAAPVYWPLARFAGLLRRFGIKGESLPLSWYANKMFYVMRTDAYDRFCTRLEKRFARDQIKQMLIQAGFEQVRFSDSQPYWCAVGLKSSRGCPD